MISRASAADFATADEDALALKPANLTFEQAAAAPMAGLVALQALRDYGKVRAGRKVLINGASGGIGTFAVQIGTSLGADVTAARGYFLVLLKTYQRLVNAIPLSEAPTLIDKHIVHSVHAGAPPL